MKKPELFNLAMFSVLLAWLSCFLFYWPKLLTFNKRQKLILVFEEKHLLEGKELFYGRDGKYLFQFIKTMKQR